MKQKREGARERERAGEWKIGNIKWKDKYVMVSLGLNKCQPFSKLQKRLMLLMLQGASTTNYNFN